MILSDLAVFVRMVSRSDKCGGIDTDDGDILVAAKLGCSDSWLMILFFMAKLIPWIRFHLHLSADPHLIDVSH